MKKTSPIKASLPLVKFKVASGYGKWGRYWNWLYDKKTKRWNRGQKDWRGQHKGYDFACPSGSIVRAILGGTVLAVRKQDSGFGLYVKQAIPMKKEIFYAHLDSAFVIPGEEISVGDLIGLSGNSGNSTGPHLHVEVRLNGQPQKISFRKTDFRGETL